LLDGALGKFGKPAEMNFSKFGFLTSPQLIQERSRPMEFLTAVVTLVLSYIIGSIPFGYLIVRWRTGEDIRDVHSGRTGGTNTMRAAGFRFGLLTSILDLLKGAVSVWIARGLFPNVAWMHAAAPIMAILGHNYSLFMLRRDKASRIRFGGGAGGAPCAGGSFGLWPFSLLIIIPVGAAIWYGIGYASLMTLTIGLVSTIVFTYRAILGQSPWVYALYGVIAEILLIWTLIPNIRRLREGTERLHGWRAKRAKAQTTEFN
jgi:glycerol-3-phosphate acyltransferase PlsY